MSTTTRLHLTLATVQDAINAKAISQPPKGTEPGDLWGYTLPDGTTKKLPAKLSGMAKVNAWHFAPNSIRQRIKAHYAGD